MKKVNSFLFAQFQPHSYYQYFLNYCSI